LLPMCLILHNFCTNRFHYIIRILMRIRLLLHHLYNLYLLRNSLLRCPSLLRIFLMCNRLLRHMPLLFLGLLDMLRRSVRLRHNFRLLCMLLGMLRMLFRCMMLLCFCLDSIRMLRRSLGIVCRLLLRCLPNNNQC
jgi:heme/copper-type cytochrome/quinol oxidase subunit 1